MKHPNEILDQPNMISDSIYNSWLRFFHLESNHRSGMPDLSSTALNYFDAATWRMSKSLHKPIFVWLLYLF